MSNEDNLEFIKVAIIGCGRISKNHVNAIFNEHKRSKIVAICDTSKERIESALLMIKNLFKENNLKENLPRTFLDFKEMINEHNTKRIKIDLVVLTTPSGIHFSQTKQAAEAGINICTEKPMAVKWKHGLEMLNITKKNNVRLFVVKQNRLNKTIQLVKKQIDKGRFGKIALVTINVFWQRPQSYYDQDKWRGTKELDGGALMNQASHYVDLIDWLIGPVEQLSATKSTIGRSIEAEDTAAIQMKWKSGALGTMAVTMLAYPRNIEGSITILGEKGSVKIGGKAVNKIELWEFSDSSEDDLIVKEASYETTSVYGFGHQAYWENMLNSLINNEKAICEGEDGLKSLEFLIASYKSSDENKFIKLPLEIY